MIRIIKKNNIGFTKLQTHRVSNSGFAILFAVTLSAIVLSIALGIANIAIKELKFTTSAKSTNEAFFAADTGIECALFNDKSTDTSFVEDSSGVVSCLGHKIPLIGAYPSWIFYVSGLGNEGQACSVVSLDKSNPISTTVISKGYNTQEGATDECIPTSNSLEREIDTTY